MLLRCFFKDMSRKEAEEKLREPDIDIGTYLVRQSGGKTLHHNALAINTTVYDVTLIAQQFSPNFDALFKSFHQTLMHYITWLRSRP